MCEKHTRRNFLGMTVGGTAALASKFSLPFPAWGHNAGGPAKSVILLWLQGAPSQLDTFDPKPGAKTGGPFKAIDTAVKGVQISEHFTGIAKRMKDVSLVRTVHSKDPNHDTATYLLHTGYRKSDTVDHPHMGSIISKELGVDADGLPGTITVGGFPGAGSGYLEPDLTPFLVEKMEKPLEDIALTPGLSRRRVKDREKLLMRQHKKFGLKRDDPKVKHLQKAYEKALEMMKSDAIQAFDVRKESAKVRAKYGKSDFAKACLMARRLVESGVRFVEIMLGDWDTHNDNFNRVEGLIKTLDPAWSALLDDLKDRRMLDDTMVVCMGEFGRTPTINRANGRDHYVKAWSVALSGGGIQGGRVVGKTDELGMEAVERPVSVQDLYATMYDRLGIDSTKKFQSRTGRPIKIIEEGKPVKELIS